MRPHLDELTAVEVSSCGQTDGDGATASAAYLTGWLASRLAWKPTRHPRRWQRADGGGVTLEFRQDEGLPAGEIGEVRLTTERADTTTAFVARRLEACSNVVLLSMDPICSTLPTRRIQLPERDATAWMCGTLQDIEPDPVFAAALRDAIRILSSSRA